LAGFSLATFGDSLEVVNRARLDVDS